MLSSRGLVFDVINIVGNFGTVFADNIRVLDEHDRCPIVVDAQGVPTGRAGVVHGALLAGHLVGPRRACPQPPPHRGLGGQGTRPSGHHHRTHGQGWLRRTPHHALYGRHVHGPLYHWT